MCVSVCIYLRDARGPNYNELNWYFIVAGLWLRIQLTQIMNKITRKFVTVLRYEWIMLQLNQTKRQDNECLMVALYVGLSVCCIRTGSAGSKFGNIYMTL